MIDHSLTKAQKKLGDDVATRSDINYNVAISMFSVTV